MTTFLAQIRTALAAFTTLVGLASCGAGVDEGQKLAQVHCAGCHQFPSPALLDKKTWQNGVLPQMAHWLGVVPIGGASGMSFQELEAVQKSGVFPKSPQVTEAEWRLIKKYYLQNAPDSLVIPVPQACQSLDSVFKVQPYSKITEPVVFIDSDKKNKNVLVATRLGKLLRLMPATGAAVDSLQLFGTFTDLEQNADGTLGFTFVGNMNPNVFKEGSFVVAQPKGKTFVPRHRINDLARPVHSALADFNADGQQDVVVCSYGYYAGELAWYEFDAQKKTIKHLLLADPGAQYVTVRDLNGDHHPDIAVLMGQAREGVYFFLNDGHGQFTQKQVLSFPPVYGSSSFELVDFNRDGFLDVLYTNGDNADYSIILKPYHGVRVFLNDGKNGFKFAYFFPMAGASKAVARDFDGDGDLDIAAISFFPNAQVTPNRGFVYLQNNGRLQFMPFASTNTDAGRWLMMDSHDYDQDGHPDLLLGSGGQTLHGGSSLLLLKNKMRQR